MEKSKKNYKKLLEKNDPSLKLNTVCPYYTMFPLDFPFKQLQKAKEEDWVLDPFCGRGTTNFAARLLGLPSVGIDSNPVAAAIAAVKLVSVSPEEIVSLAKKILRKKSSPQEIPDGDFWNLCYHKDTLIEICKIREHLLKFPDTDVTIALRALLLGILHGPKQKTVSSYLSNQMPRTYATKPNAAVNYWEKNNMKPEYVNTIEVIKRKAEITFNNLPGKTDGFIKRMDSRELSQNSINIRFNWVITSPPYLGMQSYNSDQWLRSWFLGGPSFVDYRPVGQLGHKSKERFVNDLAVVWKNISKVCQNEAKMIIRFGALPSINNSPKDLLIESLELSNCGWEVEKVRKAGLPSVGQRQATQFKVKTGNAVEEIDLYAILRN